MRLIYTETNKEVKVGDHVMIDNEEHIVTYFRPPHKSSSSGKVCVNNNLNDPENPSSTREYYVNVIGAKWVNDESKPDTKNVKI